MRAIYLSGETIYLRAMLMDDKERATAWFPGPYPVNSSRAEEFLKDAHKELWKRTFYLAVVRKEDDEVVGGVTLWTDLRHGRVRLRTAPWLNDDSAVRAAALRLLIPWLRDEAELITTTVELAADDQEAITAVEQLGLVPSVRLREWIARPGGRVDQVLFQALNPRWVEQEGRDGRA